MFKEKAFVAAEVIVNVAYTIDGCILCVLRYSIGYSGGDSASDHI